MKRKYAFPFAFLFLSLTGFTVASVIICAVKSL